MKNEKLCEYLSDIGVLLFENLDLFFQLHSSRTNKQYKNEPDRLKDSLFLYLQKTAKNENLLRQMSKQLIESYYNTQAITKYKKIKNFINILKNKLFLIYHNFIINISKSILNKNKDILNRTNSDKKIFRRSNEYSRSKKKMKNTKPKMKPKKRIYRKKRTNQYKNNYYTNIQENNTNPHSFFINNNDFYLNMYKNDYKEPFMENIDLTNEELNNNIYDDNIISYKYYSPMVNIQSKKHLNNYEPLNYIQNDQKQLLNDNNIINDLNNIPNYDNINQNQYQINNLKIQPPQYNKISPHQEFLNNDVNFMVPDDYDFFDNEQKHLQKVQNKIMNLKNEKITKLEEQCTFIPQINSTNNLPKKEKNIAKTFEKLYQDSSINKVKKEERIKKYLEEFKFTPKIEENKNYKIKTTFEQRLEKSKDKRDNYIKGKRLEQEKKLKEGLIQRKVDEKELIGRLYDKEKKKIKDKKDKQKKEEEKDKKKKVIDWKKVYKNYHEKYPEGEDYKKQLEKRKKFFESINNNRIKDDKNNKVVDFDEFLKEKNKENGNDNENKNENDKEDIKDDKDNRNEEILENDNNDKDILDNNKEIKKDTSAQEVQEAINEAYKSNSIKNLLNGTNLFKKD